MGFPTRELGVDEEPVRTLSLVVSGKQQQTTTSGCSKPGWAGDYERREGASQTTVGMVHPWNEFGFSSKTFYFANESARLHNWLRFARSCALLCATVRMLRSR